MVLLTVTPQILSAITTLPPDTQRDISLPKPIELGAAIPHTTLIRLSQLLKQKLQHDTETRQDFSLNSLLKSTSIYIPPPPLKPEPSPEYVALMARLKREQEAREYHNLTSKPDQYGDRGVTSEDEEQEKDDISPSLVFNILLSIVLCAMVGFHLSSHVFPHNDGMRVLCALGTGLVVGIAEVVVYAAYLRKVGEAKRKERGRKEVKVSLGEYLTEDLDDAGEAVMVEKEREEIWGRGKHGGVRRRVREKWQKSQENTGE